MNKVSFDVFLEVMDEAFRTGTAVCFTPQGVSMLPLLDGKNDSVTLKKPSGAVRKYDVVLFRRADGALVLHRVIGVRSDHLVIAGDSQNFTEKIAPSDVLAVMSGCNRNGKDYSLGSVSYRVYCRTHTFWKRCRIRLADLIRRRPSQLS